MAVMVKSREQKRELALELYLHSGKSQKEICEYVGWTEITFTRNKNKYNWDKLKAARTTTRDSNISLMLEQIERINNDARDEDRQLSSKEVDTVVKLSSAIEKLDKKNNIGQYIQVFTRFIEYLSEVDPEKAKGLWPLCNEFILTRDE